MSSNFEAQHPRCTHCGAWGKRFGDRIQCNNPACARTSTYIGPAEPLIPDIGYRLKPHRKPNPPKPRQFAPDQEQLNFEEGEDECDS